MKFETEGKVSYYPSVDCDENGDCHPKTWEDWMEILDAIEDTLVDNDVMFPYSRCNIQLTDLEIKAEKSNCDFNGKFSVRIHKVNDPIAVGSFLARGDYYKKNECNILWSGVEVEEKYLDDLAEKCV